MYITNEKDKAANFVSEILMRASFLKDDIAYYEEAEDLLDQAAVEIEKLDASDFKTFLRFQKTGLYIELQYKKILVEKRLSEIELSRCIK